VFLELQDGSEGPGLVREPGERLGAAHVFIEGFEPLFEVRGVGVHFQVEDGGFVAPDAAKTPASGNEVGDQIGLELILRTQTIEVIFENFDELAGIFILEYECFCRKAVPEGGHGREGAAGGCFRTAGTGAVGCGIKGTSREWHYNSEYRGRAAGIGSLEWMWMEMKGIHYRSTRDFAEGRGQAKKRRRGWRSAKSGT
jgi:hypothetical protein